MPGSYTFRPIQATLTHDTEWLGKMDPYCSYRVGPSKVKGPVCRNGGKFPKWEDATVSIPATNEPSMVVDLMDKDKILFDDNIGSFVIDLHEIQQKGQISKWYPVYWKQKPAGEILMEAAFQPGFVQQQAQPIVQQPVLVKETVIEQPVVVEKVVHEQVVQPHVQEFHSGGPIIYGTSQIHHSGQGIGLVPQQGSTFTQGSTIHQGGIIEGGHHHHHHTEGTLNQGGIIHGGSNLQQGSYNQGGYMHEQTHLPSELIPSHWNQGGNIQGGSHLQQGLNQGSIHQGGMMQEGSHLQQGLNQGLNQGSLNQGMNQGGLVQGGGLQQGVNQGTLNQGGLHQGALGQNQF